MADTKADTKRGVRSVRDDFDVNENSIKSIGEG